MDKLKRLSPMQMGGLVLAGAGAYYLWTKRTDQSATLRA